MEHLGLAQRIADGPGKNGFGDFHLVHNAVPELDLRDIDLQVSLAGKTLKYPLIINALTGGTEQAGSINRELARLAKEFGLAMAVGSQTIALEDRRWRDSFTIVREVNPEGLVFANVSATSPVHQTLQAVNMIQADGLQLHFNIPQELAMGEGDRNFRGVVDNVQRIIESCPVPIIAKEVGFGFSRECAEKLYAVGIRIIDNGGQGGTNFVAIENQRQGLFDQDFLVWGIPTAISLAEICSLQLPLQVVASGGIRNAVEAAKAIAVGADLVGISGWFLKILLNEGHKELFYRTERFLYQLESVFLMTGSQSCRDLQSKPVIITGSSAEWLRARNVDPNNWIRN